jgi:methyltransferase (TIGR00027 family)
MRAGRPSQTASLVAMIRALSDRGLTNVPGFSDPVAYRLLSPAWRVVLALTERSLRRTEGSMRARIVGQHDMVPLRVRAIDVELEAALTAGCAQVVILGAGLDTRAFRMDALRNATVFEVDHPSTQRYKRRKAQALRWFAKRLVYVPVDFERDSLTDALAHAGFDRTVKSAWIWEGVVMYLTDDALRGTLRTIAERAAPDSVLMINYHEPDDSRSARRRDLALKVVWREPQIGLREQKTMASELDRVGFEVLRDTGTADWANEFGALNPDAEVARVARIVFARRRGQEEDRR